MSLLKSIFGRFGKVAAAPATASATQTVTGLVAIGANVLNPGLGALVELIGNAVYSVELAAEDKAVDGADKKAQVQHIIDVAAPVILQTAGTMTGKSIPDPSALAPALDRLIDDVVALFHATGLFPLKPGPVKPAAAPPASTPPPADAPHAG